MLARNTMGKIADSLTNSRIIQVCAAYQIKYIASRICTVYVPHLHMTYSYTVRIVCVNCYVIYKLN